MIKRIAEPMERADLDWLLRVVWNTSVAEARARGEARGGRGLDRVVVIPSVNRPRFLAPLTSRPAATRSLVAGNGMRLPRMRFARRTLGVAFGLGLGSTLFRDELDLSAASAGSLAGHLRDVIAEVLAVDDVAFAASLGAPDPARKPVVQVLARDGRVLAYAKVGWNEATKTLVRNEVAALDEAAAARLALVRAPTVLHAAAWEGNEIAVTAPLPRGVRAHRPVDRPPPLDAIREIAGLGPDVTCALAESAYWARLVDRAHRTADGCDRRTEQAVVETLDALERRVGHVELRFGAWHGDWSPWNLSWRRGELFVLDWEYFSPVAPLGFDVVGYPFQVARSGGHRSVASAASSMRADGVPRLGELGLRPVQGAVVAELYLAELLVRARELWAGSGIRPTTHDPLLDELARLRHDEAAWRGGRGGP